MAATPTVESIALALAFGVAACGLGEGLAGALGLPSINLATMAVMASLFASVGSSINARSGGGAATPFKGKTLHWHELYSGPAAFHRLRTDAADVQHTYLAASKLRQVGGHVVGGWHIIAACGLGTVQSA